MDGFAGGGSAFLRVFSNDLFWGGLRGTLVLAGTASVFSLVVGFTVALHLSRLGETARTILVFFIALPLTFSGLIVAYGFILSYGRAGFVTQIAGDRRRRSRRRFPGFLYSPQGLAFASSYYLIPRVVMLLLPVLVNFDTAQFTAAEVARRNARSDDPRYPDPADPADCIDGVLPDRRGGDRRLRHGARARRHAGQYSPAAALQHDLGNRLRFSGRGCAVPAADGDVLVRSSPSVKSSRHGARDIMLRLDEPRTALFDRARGQRFDPISRTWAPSSEMPERQSMSRWSRRRHGCSADPVIR